MKELNLNEDNQGRTFGVSGFHNPDDICRGFSTRNVPHELAMDVGQALSGMIEEGILRGLELSNSELGEWKIENLCFAYSVILFDKSELQTPEGFPGVVLHEEWQASKLSTGGKNE